MTRIERIGMSALLVVVGAAVAAAPAAAPVVPAQVYLIKNNTDDPIRCAVWTPAQQWSAWTVLPPAAEFDALGEKGEPVHLFCGPPVEASVYRLVKGARYSLLRSAPGGAVALRRVEP